MWVKLDDSMPDDPDVDRLTDGAFRLYVAGICHAQKHLTDGLLDPARIPRMVPRYKASYAAELVASGLWLPVPDGGYTIRNFARWNKTREYWKTKQTSDAARFAAWKARNGR